MKVKLPRFADGLEQHVIIVAGAERRAGIRNVRDGGGGRVQLASTAATCLIQGGDLIAQLAHGLDLVLALLRRP